MGVISCTTYSDATASRELVYHLSRPRSYLTYRNNLKPGVGVRSWGGEPLCILLLSLVARILGRGLAAMRILPLSGAQYQNLFRHWDLGLQPRSAGPRDCWELCMTPFQPELAIPVSSFSFHSNGQCCFCILPASV